jgi:hypothetical protein
VGSESEEISPDVRWTLVQIARNTLEIVLPEAEMFRDLHRELQKLLRERWI